MSVQSEIYEILRQRGYTLATAESCTGGMVASAITEVSGVSEVYKGGFVTYTNEQKQAMLGVDSGVLEKYSAVSKETALQMAEGAAKRAGTDAGVSTTGNAGPGASEGKPVGLVYVAAYLHGKTLVRELHLSGDREQIRVQARDRALELLKEILESDSGQEGACILMCAGTFDMDAIDHSGKDFVIAVDGGLVYLDRLGIMPDLVLGDFDSLPEEFAGCLTDLEQNKKIPVKRFPSVKDDTDTMAACRIGIERGYRRFVIYGATGGRVDHTMANIQTLSWLKKHGASGTLIDRSGYMKVAENETICFEEGLRATFSLFALEKEVTGITIRGMKYPLENASVTCDYPIGVSNEITPDKRAQVEIGDGLALVIVTPK